MIMLTGNIYFIGTMEKSGKLDIILWENVREIGINFVITSYSIHYTKLYEKLTNNCRAKIYKANSIFMKFSYNFV